MSVVIEASAGGAQSKSQYQQQLLLAVYSRIRSELVVSASHRVSVRIVRRITHAATRFGVERDTFNALWFVMQASAGRGTKGKSGVRSVSYRLGLSVVRGVRRAQHGNANTHYTNTTHACTTVRVFLRPVVNM